MAPIVKMHTLGPDFIPEPIHAGGLRYHGMSPLVSLLKEHGFIEARSVHQRASFEAGVHVRPRRGDPAGARADPRDQASRSTRRWRPGRPARRGSSCSTCAATAISTCRRTSDTWTARSRTTSTRARRSRPRCAWPAQGLIGTRCPSSPAGRAVARSIRSRPLESLFAEERRCPRCGALLEDERREPSGGRRTAARTRPTTRVRPRDGGAAARGAPDGRRRPAAAAGACRRRAIEAAAGSTSAGRGCDTRRMRVAFLGFGLIGGSIARASRRGPGRRRIGWSPGRRAEAGPPGRAPTASIDPAAATPDAASRGADLVVLAGPAAGCLDALDALAGPWRAAAGAGCRHDRRREHESGDRGARPTAPGCGSSAATRWPVARRAATPRADAGPVRRPAVGRRARRGRRAGDVGRVESLARGTAAPARS